MNSLINNIDRYNNFDKCVMYHLRRRKNGKENKERRGEREREKKKRKNGTLSAASIRKFASTIYSTCPYPPMQTID